MMMGIENRYYAECRCYAVIGTLTWRRGGKDTLDGYETDDDDGGDDDVDEEDDDDGDDDDADEEDDDDGEREQIDDATDTRQDLHTLTQPKKNAPFL